MAKKATLTSALKLGKVTIPISDPHNVQAVWADLMTEVRDLNGVVAISLAAIVGTPNEDGSSSPDARICARLRIPIGTATDLRNALTRIIDGGQEGTDPLKQSVH